jgi:hypothetical protein
VRISFSGSFKSTSLNGISACFGARILWFVGWRFIVFFPRKFLLITYRGVETVKGAGKRKKIGAAPRAQDKVNKQSCGDYEAGSYSIFHISYEIWNMEYGI